LTTAQSPLRFEKGAQLSSGHQHDDARGDFHVNDWWMSSTQINACHMTMSTPMKKSNLELI